MSAIQVCQDVRSLLLTRATQLMLTDAIVGLVANGIRLSAKYSALSSADRDQVLNQLEGMIGTDDITEAVQPLRRRYEFVNQFGEIRQGQMASMIRVTLDLAKSNRVSRSELLLIKDYSFTFRELSPLFEMLREARNYFAHNTADREDIGWNGLIISALTRILERGTFLDRNRVEERAKLRAQTTQLLNQLVDAHADTLHRNLPSEVDDGSDKTDSFESDVVEMIESISSNQSQLLASSRSVASHLNSISGQIEALKVSAEKSLSAQITHPPKDQVTEEPLKKLNNGTESFGETILNPSVEPSEDETQGNAGEEEPVLASETLISVDKLYEELQILKSKIREEYESDDRWRGPSSNFLQRAIVTTIVTKEPDSVEEVLRYDDVKWRINKQKDLLNEQALVFGGSINELLSRTAWSKGFQ